MHNAYLDTISGRKQGFAAACARAALSLCTPAYSAVVRSRNRRFDRPDCSVAAPVPVISVGNLTTGGTGKTPVVAWIVNHLLQQGRRPAILSRGYKSLNGSANDEKLLLDRLCPGVPHIQNPDRIAGATEAISRYGSDILVLDDGFQHRRLRRDLDIVLIDALNPWGYGHVLPRGLLREPRSSLGRASLVMITRSDLAEPSALNQLRREIARCTSAPVLESRFQPTTLVDATGRTSPLSELRDHAIAPFCGIGNPDGFRRTLAAIDSRFACAEMLPFPDHHHYTTSDIDHIAAHAQRASATLLLTTEKDLVKLPSAINGVPLRALRLGLQLNSDATALDNQLARLSRRVAA